MNFQRMTDLDLAGKRVLIREDLNVPVKNGEITSDARLRAALPTIKAALAQGAAVMVCSHLGRPVEGEAQAEQSLAPVAAYLTQALAQDVQLLTHYLDGVEVAAGQVVLLENVRFNHGEKKNNPELAQKYAALCDVFVMDAFGTAHRAEASTEGVARFAAVAAAGPLLAAELDALGRALKTPESPMVAIVAGSKVSTKLDVLTSLSSLCDQIIVGGGIANTFLAAAGYNVGKSLCETDLIDTAKAIAAKVSVPLPTDVVVADAADIDFADFLGSLAKAKAVVKKVADVTDNDMILDVGPETAKAFAEIIKNSKTILWNGPVGVFENPDFQAGTVGLMDAIVKQPGVKSIIGGGDSAAAAINLGYAEKFSWISTGGGASMELLEGKVLPGLASLTEK